ncbi:hypothetical protein DM860_018051 [Cuscuta australis]|uniref:Uncharacterized protein n=1 Tax=Cuscuta australis TaxID=267555 RepID=A0A328DV88_9ASTE|nr:hypothetical protein DM860_018051 [Cuscuta australis]
METGDRPRLDVEQWLAGLLIGSRCGSARIQVAVEAWAFDMLGECRLLYYGELCLSGVKPEETLVEARSDTDVQIVRLTWVGGCGCFVEPFHRINSSKWAIFVDPKGRGNPDRQRVRRVHRKGIRLKFLNWDVAVDGNVRDSGDVGGGPEKSYLFCLTTCPPWKRLSRSARFVFEMLYNARYAGPRFLRPRSVEDVSHPLVVLGVIFGGERALADNEILTTVHIKNDFFSIIIVD